MKKYKNEPPTRARRSQIRSLAQRQWNAAVGLASSFWESLTDQERLAWDVAGENDRISGYNYQVKINAPRIRDGNEPLRLPPPPAPYAENPVRKLLIANTPGGVRLWLEVPQTPKAPISVWASRPCKLGIRDCHKCPLLGLLPPSNRGLCEITQLYFAKHGEYIATHRVQLVGKRIFVRTRPELDGAPRLLMPVHAIVPPPGERSWQTKKGSFL
jgi:hypothetical protein